MTPPTPQLPPPKPTLLRAASILALAAILLYFAACIYYSLGPTLGGHGESSVVCTAWEFHNGQPPYPAPDAPQRTAMVYGPMQPAFLALLFELFGPHLAPLKIAGGIVALLAFLACALAFRRAAPTPDPTSAFLALGWLALVYLKYTIFTYYLRPDSTLQLCLSVCLLTVFLRHKTPACILFALALAWGINLKFTMPVYVFPLLPLFRRRHGFRPLVLTLIAAAILAAVPFLIFPQVSFAHYFYWLTMAAAEGTERTMIIPVGGYLLLLSAPALAVIALFALRQPQAFRQLARRHLWFAIFSAITVLLVLRITGKPGAGPPHLLPLFPILGIVLAKSLAELRHPTITTSERPAQKSTLTLITSAGLLALAILIAFDIKGAVADVFLAYPFSYGKAMTREITQIADQYPQQKISMGPGSSQQSYPDLRYLPVLVLRNNPYVLDIPAMMDMQKAGRPIPDSTRQYIATGQCPLWLIPKGEPPFQLHNWYQPRAPIFDPSFRQSFLHHYKIISHTQHFDLWQYIITPQSLP